MYKCQKCGHINHTTAKAPATEAIYKHLKRRIGLRYFTIRDIQGETEYSYNTIICAVRRLQEMDIVFNLGPRPLEHGGLQTLYILADDYFRLGGKQADIRPLSKQKRARRQRKCSPVNTSRRTIDSES